MKTIPLKWRYDKVLTSTILSLPYSLSALIPSLLFVRVTVRGTKCYLPLNGALIHVHMNMHYATPFQRRYAKLRSHLFTRVLPLFFCVQLCGTFDLKMKRDYFCCKRGIVTRECKLGKIPQSTSQKKKKKRKN
ncbi:hypothetical protein POVWA2_055310 [Plasmodium ovale wallikeri]|uniref:Uncharacterized protein n=1 Tax=Plasmodium ovale wallikeri TaxID=864142 RepID=A0A1A8ZU08_PLAOA|nr:hypothetical protein POVWA1_055610 [Plasmodium ovale wallikeri]SBT48070.1 hypothetical protein POVWA2_055310 [Plasmodium ovale wallikeri]